MQKERTVSFRNGRHGDFVLRPVVLPSGPENEQFWPRRLKEALVVTQLQKKSTVAFRILHVMPLTVSGAVGLNGLIARSPVMVESKVDIDRSSSHHQEVESSVLHWRVPARFRAAVHSLA